MAALSAVHEAIAGDARLAALKLAAQRAIVSGAGQQPQPAIPHAALAGALAHSAAFGIQQQQQQQQEQEQQQQAVPEQARAVLAAVQARWQALVSERLHAAQRMLPDQLLVSQPRTPEELVLLRSRVPELEHAWERVGSRGGLTYEGPALDKLLYDADDLLAALTTAVIVDQQPDGDGSGGGSGSGAAGSGAAGSGAAGSSAAGSSAAGSGAAGSARWCLLQVVRAPSRAWLQSFFADLRPDRRQVGLDDVLHGEWFGQQSVQQAHQAAASCSTASCRAAARTGVPPSERPWVWATALGLHAAPPGTAPEPQQHAWWQLPSPRDEHVLQLLCEAVEQQGLLLDALTCADVQAAAEGEHFFVFEEAMRAVLLAFSRDASVSGQAAAPPLPHLGVQPRAAAPAGHAGQPPRQWSYPPSGVLPFRGLAALLAPLAFVYTRPAALLAVWRAMYCRHWCRLHSLSLQPEPAPGLAVLCRTFLDLLQELDPEVFAHLGRLSASPLDLAFPWLVGAFAGALAPGELLLLHDRIIGFDSLLPLPLLAVAVLAFRRELVLASESSEEVAELLADLSQLRVVPLLQALLF